MTRTSISGEFDATSFQARLKRWYRENGRHSLPWRLTRDPYAVLVSEVMLQQTQVERVLPYYERWLERWPTFAALAEASPADVIRDWRGLGYNRRALNLHRLAVVVTESRGGELPGEPAALRALPGIGPYTASAVRSFAGEERVPVADTNIARTLARVAAGAASQRELPALRLAAIAESALPSRNTRDHNLALMDLGALVCTARTPKCGLCPVASQCRWRGSGYPQATVIAKPLPTFETTARFARGRIIDALREAPATESELAALLPPAHRPKLATYLQALEADGLAIQTLDGNWALPH